MGRKGSILESSENVQGLGMFEYFRKYYLDF